MEGFDPVSVIAVCFLLLLIMAVASVFVISLNFFSVHFNKRLEKLETGQSNLEARLAKLEDGQAKLSADIAEIKQLLSSKQA